MSVGLNWMAVKQLFIELETGRNAEGRDYC